MATPDEFIEIADFRPGIWSDIHAGTVVAGLSPPTDANEGFLSGANGAATIENTSGCRVDRSGALIPLPAFIASTPTVQGTPTDSYAVAQRPAATPRAYLLDAEVSPPRWYSSNDVPLSPDPVVSVFCLWGFNYDPDGNGNVNGYYQYVLGREYRIGAAFTSIYDFAFARTDVKKGAGGDAYGAVIPAGSLTVTRFDEYASDAEITANGVRLRLYLTIPVMTALITMRNTQSPNLRLMQQGAIAAAEQNWLASFNVSPGGAGSVKRPSTYSPMMHTSYFCPSSLGISLGERLNQTNSYDPTGTKPGDEWSWHRSDIIMSTGGGALDFNAPFAPYLMVAHQGRIVFADLASIRDWDVGEEFSAIAATGFNINFTDDVLWYSRWGQPIGEVVNITGTNYMTSYIPLQVAEDQIAEVGCLGVLRADELLVIKDTGGGALVRGDLDNPNVRRLPNIEPTFGVRCKGAQTPIGFVYGSRTGVFLFDGSDATRKLSRQIDGFFWNPYAGDPVLVGSYGRFLYWNGMIHVPNNYIYDIESDSWWRWNTPQKCNIYIADSDGRMYLFPAVDESTAGAPRPLFHIANIHSLSTTWSWQSHPLVETRGRRVSIQDVRIVASSKSAAATFVVTLTGFDEQGAQIGSDAITLTCANSERPQVLREDVTPMFSAEYITVRIEAASNTANVPAPKLHSIRFGIRSRQTTPRHG